MGVAPASHERSVTGTARCSDANWPRPARRRASAPLHRCICGSGARGGQRVKPGGALPLGPCRPTPSVGAPPSHFPRTQLLLLLAPLAQGQREAGPGRGGCEEAAQQNSGSSSPARVDWALVSRCPVRRVAVCACSRATVSVSPTALAAALLARFRCALSSPSMAASHASARSVGLPRHRRIGSAWRTVQGPSMSSGSWGSGGRVSWRDAHVDGRQRAPYEPS